MLPLFFVNKGDYELISADPSGKFFLCNIGGVFLAYLFLLHFSFGNHP